MKTISTKATKVSRPRAVLYLRTATGEPDGEAAIARQQEACEAMARELGADVAGVYTDQGVSGRSLDRPGLRDLLFELAWHGRVQYVITASRDRLSRDHLHIARITALIEKGKAQLVSAAGEEETPADRFMITMTAAIGKFYRAEQARKRRAK